MYQYHIYESSIEENEVCLLGGFILLLQNDYNTASSHLRLVEFNVGNLLGAFFLFQNDYNCTMRQ